MRLGHRNNLLRILKVEIRRQEFHKIPESVTRPQDCVNLRENRDFRALCPNSELRETPLPRNQDLNYNAAPFDKVWYSTILFVVHVYIALPQNSEIETSCYLVASTNGPARDHFRWLPGHDLFATDNVPGDSSVCSFIGGQQPACGNPRRTADSDVVHAICRGSDCEPPAISTLVMANGGDYSPLDSVASGIRPGALARHARWILGLDTHRVDRCQFRNG